MNPLSQIGIGKKYESNVAILVFPFAAPNVFDFSHKTVSVISSVANQAHFVSGGIPLQISWPHNVEIHDIGIRLHYLNTIQPIWYSTLQWIYKAIMVQILMGLKVFELRREINIIYCAMGIYYQIPILVAKLLGIHIIGASMGDYSLKAKMNYGKFIAYITSFFTRFNFYLSDGIVLESHNLAHYKDLIPFKSKLLNGALFLETPDIYKSGVSIENREHIVGFIGRFVAEKGIREFVRAIPLVLEKQLNIQFLIIGTGLLDKEVDAFLQDQPWSEHVTRLGWIQHQRMPEHLQKLRLLVVPSYDEGLPNLILEAMGCGTPVLASQVGGIPDLIRNHITGFTLEHIDPKEIADSIVSAINSPNLLEITKNARDHVEKNYNFSAACQRYQAIFDS